MSSECASNLYVDLDLQSLVREMDPDWMRICEVRMSTDPVTGAHSLTESDKPGYKDKSWMTSVDKGPGTSVRRSGKFTLDKMFVQNLLEVASSQGVNPPVDAFASKGMHFFDKYWIKNSDAFKKS